MKTSIKTKKGFTVVELVIVIAVIAILAAVLIPTFVNLVNKANDAAALADARNMANQLLMNLLEHDAEGAKDLLVMQKKADGIYVHAYSASQGRIIAYKNNPVAIEDLGGTPAPTAEGGETAEPTEAEQYNSLVETLLLKLQSEAAIQLSNPQPGENDWSHPNQMSTIVETLGYNNAETSFRANYTVLVPAFENVQVDPEHKCSKDKLTHYEKQDATCTLAGYDEYWMCSECGKFYSKVDGDDSDAWTPLKELDITPALGHNWGEWATVKGATCAVEGEKSHICSRCSVTETVTIEKTSEHNYVLKKNETSHWKQCKVCGNKGTVEVHDEKAGYLKKDGKYYSICTCGQETQRTNLHVTYTLAMDLNEILAKSSTKHATLYDAFSDIAKDNSYKSISDITAKIFSANYDLPTSNLKIVWDQTIDRFSVVEDNGGTKVEVKYTADSKNGLSGKLTYNIDNTWRLWSIYNKEHSIPVGNTFGLTHVYSIYWADTVAPNFTLYGNSYTFNAGFDEGEWENHGYYQVQIGVINTTIDTHCIIRANGKTDFAIQTNGKFDFYGKFGKLASRIDAPSSSDWYVYAESVYEVYINNDAYKKAAESTTIHAMKGSVFTQSKKAIEALGYKVAEEGGTFGN